MGTAIAGLSEEMGLEKVGYLYMYMYVRTSSNAAYTEGHCRDWDRQCQSNTQESGMYVQYMKWVLVATATKHIAHTPRWRWVKKIPQCLLLCISSEPWNVTGFSNS